VPIRCNKGKPRFGVRTYKSGKRVRLVFCGNKVIEAKQLKNTGGENRMAKRRKKAKISKAKRRAAAKKAWRTRKRKYGKNGVRG